jgi:outer membrane protein insertion porin family
MLLHRFALAFALLLLPPAALAQGAPIAGPLIEVRVEGTATFVDIVRTIVAARVGTPAERIDLEAERNRVYALGTFDQVTVALEDRGAGPILLIRVRENPAVAEVEVVGAELLDAAQLRTAIIGEHLLDPGRILNTLRAERAIETLQRIYRSVGIPYDVAVSFEAIPEGAGNGLRPVRLRYLIDEQAPIARVAFDPSAVFEEEELQQIFRRLVDREIFNFALYRQAIEAVGARYTSVGLRQSGIDLDRTTLEGGLLTVRFRELRIASFDTTALGIDPNALALKVGDLFDYDALLDDVRALVVGRSSDVRIETLATASGAVRVRFAVGAPATAGPIDRIVIEGNTRLPSAELIERFSLQVGDTFTSAVADEDFRRLRAAYEAIGVVIDGRPAYAYRDGVYVQRVTEVTIAGYELRYDGPPGRTEERVVTRYLPPLGAVVDLRALDEGLRRLARLGVVTPVNRILVPGEAPGQVVVEVLLRANSTGLFQPGAQYSTETGFSASVSYAESNLWGLAHNLSAELQALTGDLGLRLGGSVRYAVPWLDIPFLDFQTTPTSVALTLFSRVSINQPLTIDGRFDAPYPGMPDREGTRVPVGEYTVRSTGASLTVARPVLPNTELVLSARGNLDAYTLEPAPEECTFDADGNVENRNRCALPPQQANVYLPQGGLNAFTSAGLAFDDRDDAAFPRSGVAANLTLGVGWGNDQRDPDTDLTLPYVYQQVQAGAKTYFLLADLVEGMEDRNHVFAVRLNVGHQFGERYPAARRFRVGRVPNEATELRGYRDTDFDLSRTYAISSVEYRYDFGFSTVATETVVAILFADLGYVSDPGYAVDTPLFFGAGAGLQINLGFAGVSLPAIRFDYGFSPRNPGGVFAFRIGSVF